MSDHSTRSSVNTEMMPAANKTTTPSIEKNPSQSATNGKQLQIRRIEFADYMDVQTRLMLVPRVEEEGIGAVISTYIPSSSPQSTNQNDKHKNETGPSRENRDDNETWNDMTGLVLIRMESSLTSTQQTEDWTDMDFTSILAKIRQTESFPIVLAFSPESDVNSTEESEELQQGQRNGQYDNSNNHNEGNDQEQDYQQQQDSIKSFLSWGQRMRAQASVAANSAKTAMAAAAKERMQNASQQTTPQRPRYNDPKPCDVFYQTSVGALLPVNTLKEPKISTTTLLLIRASATKALSTKKDHKFQWYRSSKKVQPPVLDDMNSVTSSMSSISGNNDGYGDIEWIPLEGATSSAFQPNATLVGRRLRCHVTLDAGGNASVDSDESSDDEDDLNSIGSTTEIVIELEYPIVADQSIFNGARQALARGAKFGALSGRGNAQSHTFSIDIAIGVGKQNHKQVPMSAVTIYTVSGEETIKLTDEPIMQVTADADACNSNHLDLVFPVLPEEGSMLEAVLTDGKLLIKASNRITRESLLMALGIANYQGKPGKLGFKTLLFGDDFLQQSLSLMDGDSVSSAECNTPRGGSQLLSPDKSIASSLPLHSPVATIPESVSGESPDKNAVANLTNELNMLRAKLSRKDKIVSELQRQVAKSEDSYQQMKTSLCSCQDELRQSRIECQNMNQATKNANKKVESLESAFSELKTVHVENVKGLEACISRQSDKITELEKNNKSIQNEKAVLSAAVEARESKLLRMNELQSSLTEMSEQIAKYDALKEELDESNNRCNELEQTLQKAKESEAKCQAELQNALREIENLNTRVKQEEDRLSSFKKEIEPLQKNNQKLKAERNSFKQKNDSLTKEISRICRNGRSVNEIDKILSDHESLLEEIELLRKQKKKALEEAHQYRMSYEQARAAQEKSGLDMQTSSVLERNAELERLLAEMTEYVNAKEMQLDTMKQVNDHLQQEIHSLAQANFSRNEV